MLNQRQVDASLQNQSGSCRRVYDCVPIQETWDVHEIMKALVAAGSGGIPDRKVVSGCLNDLTDAGLIRRTGRDLYRRTGIRPERDQQQDLTDAQQSSPTNNTPTESAPMSLPTPIRTLSTPATKTAPTDTLTLLAAAAETMRTNAQQILGLATHIEDLGLQLEEERETVRKKMGEIDQLKALLSSITS